MKKEKIEKLNDEMIRSQSELNDEPMAPNGEGQEPEQEQEEQEQEQEPVDEVETLKARIEELEDKNLRMMAEFDNYRRRTNKEKLELMATAGERIFTEMLPLVDDFERAIEAMGKEPNPDPSLKGREDSMLSGVKLIYNKFLAFLAANDVHPIETEGVDFNTDEHEAVTTFAAGEENKGKVIDCTQKGYKLGEKVIRFAKVVVGE
jgi:molecular chaperone GrpE